MRFVLPLLAIVLLADFAGAEVTNITVRVVARNAQYVGDWHQAGSKDRILLSICDRDIPP